MATTINAGGGNPTITIKITQAQKGRYSTELTRIDGLMRVIGEGRSDDGILDTHAIGLPGELSDALVDWVIFSDSPGGGAGQTHSATVTIEQDGKVCDQFPYGSTAPPYYGMTRIKVV